MSLPHLPPALCRAADVDCYTPDQLKEYGKACRAAALEEAASLCDGAKWVDSGKQVAYIDAFNAGCRDCEEVIRMLK